MSHISRAAELTALSRANNSSASFILPCNDAPFTPCAKDVPYCGTTLDVFAYPPLPQVWRAAWSAEELAIAKQKVMCIAMTGQIVIDYKPDGDELFLALYDIKPKA